jgi:hypothetical protein
VIKSTLFLVRILVAWCALFFLAAVLWSSLPLVGWMEWPIALACLVVAAVVVPGAFSHIRRVRLIAGRVDGETLGNRHKRQIEIPLEAGEAFDLLEAAIRELPGVENVAGARDSLQVRAKVKRTDPYGEPPFGRWNPMYWIGIPRNQILATVTPHHDTGSVTLICEPESAAWSDWFRVDHGTNYENLEAITRAISRRVAEQRRHE